jgi:hypothetical protein
MLADKPLTFSQMLEELGVSSSHLTYHLESLGELVTKANSGEYSLSTFGRASVNTMRVVEEAPAVVPKLRLSMSRRWKSVLAFLIIGFILLASMSFVQYGILNQLSDENKVLASKYDQLLSWSSSTDDAITFLRDIVQFDISAYHATLLSNTVESRSDLGGIIEEILRYSLTSSESKIEVVIRFRDNQLSRYQMDLLEGSPIYAQPQPFLVTDTAESILQRLSSLDAASYLEPMRNMLASVNETENFELTQGNTKLKVSLSGGDGEVMWLYTENGVDFSPKSLSLVFEDGVLKKLTDGWYMWKIGSTTVNISNDEAIAIARNAARGFSWNADGEEVTDFNVLEDPVSAVFHPTPREDPLSLVPYWYITLYLDKVYPGGINRIGVGLWADTGEVAQVTALSG